MLDRFDPREGDLRRRVPRLSDTAGRGAAVIATMVAEMKTAILSVGNWTCRNCANASSFPTVVDRTN